MHVKDYLNAAELEEIGRRSNLKAAWLVLCNYAIVAALFAMVAVWPNPLTVVLAVMLLGTRQLGFGVLVHECGHGTLFETRALNDFVGNWLAAPLTFNNMPAYIRGHLHHHRLAGTAEDPDLPNYRDYPITADRLRRKVTRDLTGQTGWRTLRGIGRGLRNFSALRPDQQDALRRGVVANLALLGLLAAMGHAWLYLLWVAAFLTTNPLVSRIRQVAEHAAVPDLYASDPRLNTRTVITGWFDRLVFAPLGVNWHLEHHMLASVPIYNLERMHELLQARGAYQGVRFPRSYVEMLRGVLAPAQPLAT